MVHKPKICSFCGGYDCYFFKYYDVESYASYDCYVFQLRRHIVRWQIVHLRLPILQPVTDNTTPSNTMSFDTTSSNTATNSTNYECQSYNIANRAIKQLLLCCRSKQRKIDLVNCMIAADAEQKHSTA